MSVESWDSRSFGSAECVRCGCDICDDLAGLGAVLCKDCLKIESTIHFKNESLNALPILKTPAIDEAVSCCDYHASEGLNSAPCATWQGGSNFAPNFGEENEGDEFDFENELFKSHIEHSIHTNNFDILELLRRWESLPCPSECGENITFEEEGSSVFASCECCRVGAVLNYVFP